MPFRKAAAACAWSPLDTAPSRRSRGAGKAGNSSCEACSHRCRARAWGLLPSQKRSHSPAWPALPCSQSSMVGLQVVACNHNALGTPWTCSLDWWPKVARLGAAALDSIAARTQRLVAGVEHWATLHAPGCRSSPKCRVHARQHSSKAQVTPRGIGWVRPHRACCRATCVVKQDRAGPRSWSCHLCGCPPAAAAPRQGGTRPSQQAAGQRCRPQGPQGPAGRSSARAGWAGCRQRQRAAGWLGTGGAQDPAQPPGAWAGLPGCAHLQVTCTQLLSPSEGACRSQLQLRTGGRCARAQAGPFEACICKGLHL